MPMLDAYIPEGALPADAEEKLLARATDLLLQHEGVDPTNEAARQIAWVFVHRPTVFVAGAPATKPRYRFVCQVPEGQYDDERRQAITAALTDAVVEVEGGAHGDDAAARVWVFTFEIPDGTWGGLGRVVRLPDIAEYAVGPEGRVRAEQVLADRRRQTATALLDAVREDTGV
jgi:phenylpyruvate tautomerase PptA (4-oxalocrotonate tautomerase family)